MQLDGMLIAAAIKGDRNAYETFKRTGLDIESLPEAAGAVIRACSVYYRRDPNAKCVSTDILRAQIVGRFGEGDVSRSIMDFVASFPKDISGINVAEEYRSIALRNTEIQLAGLLATGHDRNQLDELLARRESLLTSTFSETDDFRLDLDDFEEDKIARIPVAPTGLNSYLNGGVKRGHNLVVYGRPDSGKSGFTICNAAFWIKNGYTVLYVANEEPREDITQRLLSSYCQVDIARLSNRDNLRKAFTIIEPAYERWHLLHKAGCTPADIGAAAQRVKPDIIVVDQLKNLACREDNRALQLDKLAREIREIAIDRHCVTCSVTQAGDSAEGKPVLSMGDIEWSNTGIPGAADVMVGIGVDDTLRADRKRMLSVPKNKASGKHGAFPCWFYPETTTFV